MFTRQLKYKRLMIAVIFIIGINVSTYAQEIVNYSYDDMNRLARAAYADSSVVDYTYDLMGNRFTKNIAVSASPANNPPNLPTQPSPADAVANIDPLSVTIAWTSSDPDVGDELSYDIYFGASSPPVLYKRTRSTAVQIEQLDILQTYFWKIVAKDSRGGITEGPIWSFTTLNNPPGSPEYKLPYDSSEIVPENATLSWAAATDPNPGDTIAGYDIYFGTTSNPPLVVSDHTDTHYLVGNLDTDTTYYWKIVARDNHGAQSPGSPVWFFKTYDHAPVVLSNPTYSSDTTLTKNNGPYIVQGSMAIDSGVTLTIEPGAIFKFENDATLNVNGTLAAQGNAANSIIFTSYKDDRYGGDTNGDGNASMPDRGDWGGIVVSIGSANGMVTLKFCRIEFGTIGISVASIGNNATLAITDNIIRQHSEDGISIDGRSGASISVDMTNNQVEENGGIGIHFYTADQSSQLSGQISESIIAQNDGYGIYVHTYTKALCDLGIIDNTLYHNQDYGIYAFSHYTYQYASLFTIKDNRIYESGTGIFCNTALSEMSVDIIGNECSNGNDGIKCFGYSGAMPLYALITNNEVYGNSNIGIYCDSRLAKVYPVIRQNKVYENQNGGVHCLRYDEGVNHIIEPVITLNEVYENEGYGIFCQTSAEAVLLYNEVRNNLSSGVYIESDNASVIHFNNMYSNAGNSELENGNSTAVDARFNFWGNFGTYEIESGDNPKNISRIYDIYDDSARGTAYYLPAFPNLLAMPSTPVSNITLPLIDHEQKSSVINIKGIAVSPNGVDLVEVSTDNGVTWTTAAGRESWNIELTMPGDGTYTILSRITDKLSQVETPGSGVTFTVSSSLPTTKGTLTGNETWSGEMAITGDVVVPQGVTLTIDPGAIVRFLALNDEEIGGSDGSRSELIIEGSLVADQVTFTSSNTSSPAAGDWYGIVIQPSSGSSTISLTDCIVEYATVGIKTIVTGADVSLTLTDSVIRHNADDGIYINASSGSVITLNIDHTQITNNGGRGMYVYLTNSVMSDLDITGNTIHGNQTYGIFTTTRFSNSAESIFNISNNTIYNSGTGIYCLGVGGRITANITGNEVYNGTDGIYCYAYSSSTFSVLIDDNTVHDNSGRGIYCHANYQGNDIFVPEIRSNQVYNNTGDGIYCYKQRATDKLDPIITLNNLYGNGGYGIYCEASVPVDVHYNDIHDNTGNGLYLEAGNGSNVNYNNIYENNGSYDLENGNVSGVNARFNYWGSSVTAEMETGVNPKNITRIYDVYDDVSLGAVSYAKWLSAPVIVPAVPTSKITSPFDGDELGSTIIQVKGIAVSQSGVDFVEVSTDNGATWTAAAGRESWNVELTFPGDGTYTILSRVTDKLTQVETPGLGVTITINTFLPTTSGPLGEDETWSGEVTVTGDVTVPAGITLTMEPGTVVYFQALSDDQGTGQNGSLNELIIGGSLVADQVTFTSSDTGSPAAGDWYGIVIQPSSGSSTISLTDCIVEYATVGIKTIVTGADVSLTLTDSVIRHNADDGIYIDAQSGSVITLNIDHTQITNNGGRGMYCFGAGADSQVNGSITDSTIADNSGNGLYVYLTSSVLSNLDITGNTIHDNQSYGIFTTTRFSNSGESIFDISNNTIYNSGTGIYCFGVGGRITANITGNEVYNGTDGIYCYAYSSSTFSALIEDNNVHDNSGRGVYCYSSYQVYGLFSAEIRSNQIYNNASDGIYCYKRRAYDKLDPVITLNNVHDNVGYGIYCWALEPVDVLYNDIHDNTGNGLYLEAGDGSHVNHNNLYGNGGLYDLENGNSYYIDSQNNYWGTSTTNEMDSGGNPKNITRIYDNFDNSGIGTVDYANWLNDYMENIDSDADGLTNIWEYANGLDPHLVDTDNDGLDDGDEKTYWGGNWNADPDSDGLINILDPDSDNDGILDGDEV